MPYIRPATTSLVPSALLRVSQSSEPCVRAYIYIQVKDQNTPDLRVQVLLYPRYSHLPIFWFRHFAARGGGDSGRRAGQDLCEAGVTLLLVSTSIPEGGAFPELTAQRARNVRIPWVFQSLP